MVNEIRNLHRVIPVEINGHIYNFYTIGYIAHVLRRTVGTINHWVDIELFPMTPFTLYSEIAKTSYRIYPEAFIEELQIIVGCRYLGKRLSYYDRKRFYNEVNYAFERTVSPLITQGVIEGSTLKVAKDMTRQVILTPTHSI